MRQDGHDGELEEYRVAYTFGTAPLQQYLTDMGGGRLQASPVVWDAREGGQGSYHLQPHSAGQPNDVLHWTGSGQNCNHICADCHSTTVTKGFDAAMDTYATVSTRDHGSSPWRISETNTDRAESLNSRALVHQARGDIKTAEADLMLALSPQGLQVRVAMALCHVRQGNLAQGIETLAEGYAKRLDAGSAYIYAVALRVL